MIDRKTRNQSVGGAYGKPAVYGPGDTVDQPYCGGLALDLTEVLGPPPAAGPRGPSLP
ncbi:MAG: hypothetical protein ACUVT2_05560 [Thiobacillaceae bacterium]